MRLNDFWNKQPLWEAPTDPTAGGQPPENAAADGPDLSFIPPDYHVDGKPDLAKFRDDYQAMVAADAQRKEARATVPEDGNYTFALPEDLKFEGLELPEGFTVTLDPENPDMQPLFGELGQMLKDMDAPAEYAGKLSGLVAKYEATKEAARFKAWSEDMKSLGNAAQISARVGAVQRILEAKLPADQVKGLFSGDRISAAGIKALETLVKPSSLTTPAPQPKPIGEMTLEARYPNSKAS